jgi:hypothetical protein
MNRNRGADKQGKESELQRRGVTFKDDLANWRLEFEGLAYIAAAELPKVVRVLRVERQIQSECVT